MSWRLCQADLRRRAGRALERAAAPSPGRNGVATWLQSPLDAARRRVDGGGGPERFADEPLSLDFARNLEDVDLAAHEWVGLVYYRGLGLTEEWFPGP